MSNLPAISDVWNFSDLETTEQSFRELITQAEQQENLIYTYELITQIARTYSLRSRFDEAHKLLDSIEIHKHIVPIVEVRYLLERGRTYNSANQHELAIPLFREAWDIAKKNQLDYLAIDAAHMLGIAETDPTIQIKWSQTALDYAEDSDQTDSKKWLGSLYNNLGWSYHDAGNYKKALGIFQKGVTYWDKQGKVIPLRIAKWTVGRALRSLKRYNEALELQQTLLADYQSSGDEDGFVCEELGENLIALNRHEDAKSYFTEAYRLLKDISWIEAHRLERVKMLGK